MMTGICLQGLSLDAEETKILLTGQSQLFITDSKLAHQYNSEWRDLTRLFTSSRVSTIIISRRSLLLLVNITFRQSQYFLNQKKNLAALQHLEIALSMSQHSSDILIARSKCLAAEGQWREALRSAENILEMEETNIQAILVKAESLYYTSQFEYALLNFHKGQVKQRDLK